MTITYYVDNRMLLTKIRVQCSLLKIHDLTSSFSLALDVLQTVENPGIKRRYSAFGTSLGADQTKSGIERAQSATARFLR